MKINGQSIFELSELIQEIEKKFGVKSILNNNLTICNCCNEIVNNNEVKNKNSDYFINKKNKKNYKNLCKNCFKQEKNKGNISLL